ncbi:MAG TPA: RsmE family RNA methyltransferase, partial [Thermoanaerobaculia bacterium]|nr:RsmE family RNA methyltransferase [Thermoanaerobaculia bacterium]
LGGGIGRGEITRIDDESMEMEVAIDRDPPPALPVTLVLALPRPKVLNRVIAAATSMGVKRIFLINSWRVEKSYWSTPRLSRENLFEQVVAGLEQARDTIPPVIETKRLFRPFVENELAGISEGSLRLVAHPYAVDAFPPSLTGRATLAIGPDGGFIDREIASFERIGFVPVTFGARILRVETAVAVALGRLC